MAAFMAVAQILQGVADAALARSGQDEETAVTGELGRALREMASVIVATAGLAPSPEGGSAFDVLDALAADGPDDWRDEPIACRMPEGYAHYAVYPEAYATAAMASGLDHRTRVVGLRSIGTGLGAMVAAALGSAPASTLRPVGDPFDRQVVPGPALRRSWSEAPPDVAFAVVDEGPGASGSSFRAAVRCLEECGVARDRIHLFPSHPNGPGPEGPPDWQDAWGRLHRHPADTDRFLGLAEAPSSSRLAGWIGEAAGASVLEIRDVSAGRWRSAFWSAPSDWPPSGQGLERVKALARTERGPVVARFAGLGPLGEEKLALSRALAACGFVPEPLGLTCGFLVERWQEGARPAATREDRQRILAVLPDYLAARAHLFPALGRRGATLPALASMVRRNAGLVFGQEAEAAAAPLAAAAASLGTRVRPVCIDGRLDLGEWLVGPGSRVRKTDAIDHHDDHGLVGCQDIAWDVAGASVEFDLDPAQTAALCAAIGERGVPAPDADLVAFYRPCYAASRMAADTVAASMAGETTEIARLQDRADRYARVLAASLGLVRAEHARLGGSQAG